MNLQTTIAGMQKGLNFGCIIKLIIIGVLLFQQMGVFAQGEPLSAASGHFVHVYVDSASRRPVPLPPALQSVLKGLLK